MRATVHITPADLTTALLGGLALETKPYLAREPIAAKAPMTSSSSSPPDPAGSGHPWWTRLAVLAVACALVALAIVLVNRAAPVGNVNQATVVDSNGILVGPGPSGAVDFPFQASASGGVSGDASTGIVNASLSGHMTALQCGAPLGSARCSGLVVEIVDSAGLRSLESGTPSTPLWCYAPTGGCGPATAASFSAPLSGELNGPLYLVLLLPDPNAPVTLVSASATLFWTG